MYDAMIKHGIAASTSLFRIRIDVFILSYCITYSMSISVDIYSKWENVNGKLYIQNGKMKENASHHWTHLTYIEIVSYLTYSFVLEIILILELKCLLHGYTFVKSPALFMFSFFCFSFFFLDSWLMTISMKQCMSMWCISILLYCWSDSCNFT